MTATPRQRLAQLMDLRRTELGLTWDHVAADGSTHAETLRQVRKGDRPIRDLTKRAIETGLRWEAGSVDTILAGGHPTEQPPRPSAGQPQPPADLLPGDTPAHPSSMGVAERIERIYNLDLPPHEKIRAIELLLRLEEQVNDGDQPADAGDDLRRGA